MGFLNAVAWPRAARAALRREHAMMALARFMGQLCKLFETYGGVTQVAQNETGNVGLTVRKRRSGLIQ
jgi:hypothetical protein